MTESKGVKLPFFKGDDDEFQKWRLRFKAYAKVKKFHDVLDKPKANVYPASQDAFDAMDPSDADYDKYKAKLERNSEAVAQLLMALDSDSLLNKIYEAQDNEWPEGMAWKIMKSLDEEFHPGDCISGVELKRKLNKVSMKKKDHPKVLFEQLAKIENMYKANVKSLDEDYAIAVVLDKAPDEYAHVLASEEGIYGNNLKLKHLKAAMIRQYCIVYGKKQSNDNDGSNGELQLSAFNGTCYFCGEKGHKANKYPKKKEGKKGGSENGNSEKIKFTGNCNFCGKVGHKEKDCWDKPENASKSPKNWKSSEKGLSAKNEEQSDANEFMLMALMKVKS